MVVLTGPWAFHPGDDMAVANSLPLGLSVVAEYGETAFHLQIATEGQQFGQQDDITVVTVIRMQ